MLLSQIFPKQNPNQKKTKKKKNSFMQKEDMHYQINIKYN